MLGQLITIKIDKSSNYKKMFKTKFYKNIRPKEIESMRASLIMMSMFIAPFVSIGLFKSNIFEGSKLEIGISSLLVGFGPAFIYIFAFDYLTKSFRDTLKRMSDKEFSEIHSEEERSFLKKNYHKIISMDESKLKEIYKNPLNFRNEIEKRSKPKIKLLMKKLKNYNGKMDYTNQSYDGSILITVAGIITSILIIVGIIEKDISYFLLIIPSIIFYLARLQRKKEKKQILKNTKSFKKEFNEIFTKINIDKDFDKLKHFRSLLDSSGNLVFIENNKIFNLSDISKDKLEKVMLAQLKD